MKSKFVLLLVTLSTLATWSQASIIQGTIDKDKYKSIFEENIQTKDIATLYYAALGHKLLNIPVKNNVKLCDDLKNVKYDTNNVEEIYYLSNAAALTSCQNSLSSEIMKTATFTLDKKDVTMPELYYAINILKALGRGQVSETSEAVKSMSTLLKSDDAAINYAYAFDMCVDMGCQQWSVAHIEDVLAQADEVDGRLLQWEGGLAVTAPLISSILRTLASSAVRNPLKAEQGQKLAAYLMSRRSVRTPKGAALLLQAAYALADNKNLSPVSITLKGNKFISSDKDLVQVSVTDILGRPVAALGTESPVAQSATRLADDVVVLSKQTLTPHPQDRTLYTLDLMKVKPQYGQYKIAVSAAGKSSTLTVSVLGAITVESVELGVGDLDGSASPKTTQLKYPNTLQQELQADHLQKLFLKFVIKNAALNKPVGVQQAFLRVYSEPSNSEVIFVAEPDTSKTYKVDLNIGTISRHFGHQSGRYSLELLLGDSSIANPMRWKLTDINFSFSSSNAVQKAKVSSSQTGALPEIEHLFRVPEARPPRLVSDVFAALCAAPLLLLLVLWLRIGANVRNFPFSLSAIGFHAGLGSILGLFVVFWLQLNMFDTMRYLSVLGLATFLCGHQMLRNSVTARKGQ